MSIKRVCVYCGSNNGSDPKYAEAAKALGVELARRGLGLVYGGGRVGLMGTIADAAMAAGGKVIGVIPQALATKEIAHSGLSELRVVDSMHERKAMMVELADAFIAMPGGFGTLEEFCEVLTWAQLGLHRKPHGLLSVAGFYDSLLGFFDHAVNQGFIRSVHRKLVITETDPYACSTCSAKRIRLASTNGSISIKPEIIPQEIKRTTEDSHIPVHAAQVLPAKEEVGRTPVWQAASGCFPP